MIRASLLLAVGAACASLSAPPKPEVPATPAAAAPGPSPGAATPASAGFQPDAPAGRHEAIRELARRGWLDSALGLCHLSLGADSNDNHARFLAGKLATEGKASASHFQKLLASGLPGPESGESRFRLGQYQYAAGKYHLAIPYFRDYLRLYPQGDWRDPALYWMGHACLSLVQSRPEKSGYLDTALAYFQKLRDQGGPDNYYQALALAGMAKILMAKGDGAGAYASAMSALEKAPDDERAPMLLLAAQLRRNVDYEEEKRLLARLAAEHPQSPEVRYLRKLNGGSRPDRWRAPSPPAARQAGLDSAATGGSPGQAGTSKPAEASATGQSTPRPDTPPPGAGAYTLQLGAFSQAANAHALVADLAAKGLQPELTEGTRGGQRIYQVRLGRFADAEAALEHARLHLKPHSLLFQAIPVP